MERDNTFLVFLITMSHVPYGQIGLADKICTGEKVEKMMDPDEFYNQISSTFTSGCWSLVICFLSDKENGNLNISLPLISQVNSLSLHGNIERI